MLSFWPAVPLTQKSHATAVSYRTPKRLLPPLVDEIGMDQIGAGGGAQLVQGLATVPDTGAALDDGDDLLAEAGGELLAAGAGRALLVDDVEDPHDGLPTAGARVDGFRYVERVTTAGQPLQTADAHYRRHRVDGEREVEERVQRKLGGRWRAGEQRTQGRDLGWRAGAEVVEDQGDVLFGTKC